VVLPSLRGRYDDATDINSAGEVVGVEGKRPGSEFYIGLLWKGRRVTRLDRLVRGGESWVSFPLAISDTGHIIAWDQPIAPNGFLLKRISGSPEQDSAGGVANSSE
jgi:hypothetical protein